MVCVKHLLFTGVCRTLNQWQVFALSRQLSTVVRNVVTPDLGLPGPIHTSSETEQWVVKTTGSGWLRLNPSSDTN
jgi:hypothetical protein